MKSRWLGAFVALMVLALGGCSGDEPAVRGFAAAFGADADETLDALFYEQLGWLRDDVMITCMKNEGFAYVPEPQFGGWSGRVGDQGALSDEDYASTYGFGISTAFSAPGLSLPDPTEHKSANADHLESLGEAEAIAWHDQSSDCHRQAYEAQDRMAETFLPFYEAQEQIRQAVAADRRVVAAKTDWVACMSAQGFSFADHDEMLGSLLNEFRSLPEVADQANRTEAVSIDAEPSLTDEGLAFADREIAVAEASFACSKDLRAIEHAVRLDLEDQRLQTDPTILQALTELTAR